MAKSKRFVFGTPISVTWRDTTGHAGWHELEQPPMETIEVQQLGFYMGESKDTLWICSGMASDPHQVLEPSAIPRGCITKLRRIKA